jgi:hypothetical protein
MKTIALMCIGAALALAVDQDDKKAADPKAKTPATAATPATPAKPGRPSAPVANQRVNQPAKRNLHQPTVTPSAVPLTPEQKASAALPSVPKDAKEVGPNLYRYTDAQGKNWMYRKTPFGVSKWEEKPGEQEPRMETPAAAGLSMTDLGDSVQFQRLTPFGPQKWTRKKSEMTDDEKAAFATQESARQSALGAKPADAVKPPEQH